jgi:hypothetical protein
VPVYRLKRFASPEVLRKISPQALLALLRPHRVPLAVRGLSLPRVRDATKLDHAALLRILAAPDADLPRDLADAFYYINEMATPEGMDALAVAVPDERPALMFGAAAAPADVAVQAWLRDHLAVERAYEELTAYRPRRFEYFQNPAPQPLPFTPPDQARLRPLEATLDEVFASRGRGRGVRVSCFPHEHDCLFTVRHGDPYRREGALRGREETSVLYRPLRFDVIVYDPAAGTLRVHAKTKWETSLYRGQFGLHLFGAIDHFPGEGRYTLEPLRGGDRVCLSCADAAPLKFASLVEVHLAWGGIYDAVDVYRARDVFAALKQRKAEVPRGPRIVRATFELYVFGDVHPRTVTVIPPNVARYSREEDSHLIDRWLALRGFIGPAAAANEHVGQQQQQLSQLLEVR